MITEKKPKTVLKTFGIDNNNSMPQTLEFYELCRLDAITQPFETHDKFDTSYDDSDLSPIDLFIINTRELNKLLKNDYNPVLGNLLLLGYISAAESYLRALIRRLINCDKYIFSLVAEKNVPYGAAHHHSKKLLPEALLEDFSLANPYNVFETLRNLIGMNGNKPASLNVPIEEFKKICELRHCCVHRFGKLGSKNAIRLGLRLHSKSLEKPIKLAVKDIDKIAFIVDNFVRSINNYIYRFILERTAKNKDQNSGKSFYNIDWLWDYKKDRKRFEKYYSIFSTIKDLTPSMPMAESYKQFCLANKPKLFSLHQKSKK